MAKKLMFIIIICLLLILAFLWISKQPMSWTELQAKNIFPEKIGEMWELAAGSPNTPDPARKGYIHAIYTHKKRFGFLKIWVIDKVSPEKAAEWLTALLNGTHTTSTIEPLHPSGALDAKAKELYKEFLKNPITVMGNPGYERFESNALKGDSPRYAYYLYYTQGRFVIGVNDMHNMQNMEEIRKEIWPVLENLNLPE
jgi:hypothetical protein